jgi:hypothetical protein
MSAASPPVGTRTSAVVFGGTSSFIDARREVLVIERVGVAPEPGGDPGHSIGDLVVGPGARDATRRGAVGRGPVRECGIDDECIRARPPPSAF